MESNSNIRKLPHHERKKLCTTRPPYRQGRKLTAVKVPGDGIFNEESQHLLIRGVPALDLLKEMKNLCMRYGEVKLIHQVKNYAEDEEQFTEVFHVLFAKIQSARFAKHMIDDKSFFGGVLHVFYAPELETIPETRHKLNQRREEVLRRIQHYRERESRMQNKATHNPSQPGSSNYYPKGQNINEQSRVNYDQSDFNTHIPFVSNTKQSFAQAGVIGCEFISNKSGKAIRSNSNEKANFSGTANSQIQANSNIKRTIDKSSNKFIPPQVKRIRFNPT